MKRRDSWSIAVLVLSSCALLFGCAGQFSKMRDVRGQAQSQLVGMDDVKLHFGEGRQRGAVPAASTMSAQTFSTVASVSRKTRAA